MVYMTSSSSATSTNWIVGNTPIDVVVKLSGNDYNDYSDADLVESTNVSTSSKSRYVGVAGSTTTLTSSLFVLFNNVARD